MLLLQNKMFGNTGESLINYRPSREFLIGFSNPQPQIEKLKMINTLQSSFPNLVP